MFPLQEIDMARKIMYLAIFHGKVETNTTEKNYYCIKKCENHQYSIINDGTN